MIINFAANKLQCEDIKDLMFKFLNTYVMSIEFIYKRNFVYTDVNDNGIKRYKICRIKDSEYIPSEHISTRIIKLTFQNQQSNSLFERSAEIDKENIDVLEKINDLFQFNDNTFIINDECIPYPVVFMTMFYLSLKNQNMTNNVKNSLEYINESFFKFIIVNMRMDMFFNEINGLYTYDSIEGLTDFNEPIKESVLEIFKRGVNKTLNNTFHSFYLIMKKYKFTSFMENFDIFLFNPTRMATYNYDKGLDFDGDVVNVIPL